MKTEKKHKNSSSRRKGRQIFEDAKMQDAKEIGITLQIDEKVLKELNEIQEEAVEAIQERQKLLWR